MVGRAHAQGLLSDEHFTVDGTLIEAAASLKTFRPKDGEPPATDGDPDNPTVDFHGEKRSNKTHRSTTDSEARLYKKGKREGGEAGASPPNEGRRRVLAAASPIDRRSPTPYGGGL